MNMKMRYLAPLAIIAALAPQITLAAPLQGPFVNHSGMTESEIYAGIGRGYVEAAYVYSAIVGTEAVASVQDIALLRAENASLRSQLSDMESRIRRLENAGPSVAAAPVPQSVNTTVIQQADMGRVDALEKRVKTVEMVVSMIEVNVGSIYAYVDQALAPIRKVLGLK